MAELIRLHRENQELSFQLEFGSLNGNGKQQTAPGINGINGDAQLHLPTGNSINRKLNILVFSYFVSHSPDAGAKRRVYTFCKQLKKWATESILSILPFWASTNGSSE